MDLWPMRHGVPPEGAQLVQGLVQHRSVLRQKPRIGFLVIVVHLSGPPQKCPLKFALEILYSSTNALISAFSDCKSFCSSKELLTQIHTESMIALR